MLLVKPYLYNFTNILGVIPPPPDNISFANLNGRITKTSVLNLDLVML